MEGTISDVDNSDKTTTRTSQISVIMSRDLLEATFECIANTTILSYSETVYSNVDMECK